MICRISLWIALPLIFLNGTVDERVQEVTLLGDPENEDSTSLSIISDVVEQSTLSSETPINQRKALF